MVRLIPRRYKVLAALSMVLVLLLIVATPALAAPSRSPSSSGHVYHCVRWGETLTSIGWRYGVSPWAIAQYNGIRNPNYIRAGQCLVIPRAPVYCCPPPPPPPPCWRCGGWWYVVHRGDTLWSIGWRFGRDPYHIARVNGIWNPNLIYAGQWLWIP